MPLQRADASYKNACYKDTYHLICIRMYEQLLRHFRGLVYTPPPFLLLDLGHGIRHHRPFRKRSPTPLRVMHVRKPSLTSGRVSFSAFRAHLLRRGKVHVRDQLRPAVENGSPRRANRGRLRVISRPAAKDVPHRGVRGVRLEG